jgi:hypothetical protein
MYNDNHSLTNVSTAGKITVVTTLLGVLVFAFIFLLNIGKQEFQLAIAQDTASTSVTVLNTPPQWTVNAFETVASATTTPTNSGTVLTWSATAVDSNNEPYRLLICSGNATPTPGTSTTTPTCGSGVRWAVSATTSSGVAATAATTTSEAFPPFAERNNWYGFVCDAINLNARCNAAYTGVSSFATGTPFHVNRRPTFTAFWDNSPANPGATVTFTATSSDPDVVGGNDTLKLWVCATSSYNATTNSCGPNGTLASSTFGTGNRTATYTIVIPTQDTNFQARGYVVDQHGHEATGATQGSNSVLTVNNVAPTINASDIDLNLGTTMQITNAATQTPNFRLQFVATDNNSCLNASSSEEVTDYVISVYRSGIGSSSCDGLTAGNYDPNDCYVSAVPQATWNLNCTATTTPGDCNFAVDGIDRTRTYNCTFPLWFVADPTDGGATNTVYFAENWRAEVRAIDDDNATGTSNEGDFPVDVSSLLAFALNTVLIPYGELEPGQDTGTLNATTSASATGNVGIDQTYDGESMCTNYTGPGSCATSATSTIPVGRQEFGTTTLGYGAGINLRSTSTPLQLEIDILKSTTTSSTTRSKGTTYWGIEVPGTISLAGVYTGENTFYAVTAEPADWY